MEFEDHYVTWSLTPKYEMGDCFLIYVIIANKHHALFNDDQ
jgi:hypothetical protein